MDSGSRGGISHRPNMPRGRWRLRRWHSGGCCLCQSAKGSGFKIALQVLLCPVTDIAADNQSRREFAEGYFLEGPLMSWAGTHYLPSGVDINDPRLSPLRAPDLSGLPPAHIHTAGFDLLRDEGQAVKSHPTATPVSRPRTTPVT